MLVPFKKPVSTVCHDKQQQYVDYLCATVFTPDKSSVQR